MEGEYRHKGAIVLIGRVAEGRGGLSAPVFVEIPHNGIKKLLPAVAAATPPPGGGGLFAGGGTGTRLEVDGWMNGGLLRLEAARRPTA